MPLGASASQVAPSKKQTAGKKGPRPKHVPQRTCIACRTTGAKRGLLRLVRTPEGRIEIDQTGKKTGRGAYLCRTRECWQTGLTKKGLDRALKIEIEAENRLELKNFGDTLPERDTIEVE